MEKEKKRIVWVDCFRIVSIFLMMQIHTSASQYFNVPVESPQWLVFHIYDSISQIAVPCFVMISGIFFLDRNKEITVKNLFCKNIKRIVTAFAFWYVLYLIFDICVMKKDRTAIVNELLNGHYHMWFLFMITGLYLITPFVREITKNQKMMYYFILLSMIVSVVIPTVRYNGRIAQYTGGIVVNMNLSFLTGYTVYFVLGYWLSQTDLTEKYEKVFYMLGIIGLLTTILLSYYIAMRDHSPNAYYSNFSLFICLQSVAVFVFFKERVSRIRFSEKGKKIITELSGCCFGMYLIHDFFNMIFLRTGFITTAFYPVLSVPVINTVVFVVSFVCIFMLRKIGIFRKYFS